MSSFPTLPSFPSVIFFPESRAPAFGMGGRGGGEEGGRRREGKGEEIGKWNGKEEGEGRGKEGEGEKVKEGEVEEEGGGEGKWRVGGGGEKE